MRWWSKQREQVENREETGLAGRAPEIPRLKLRQAATRLPLLTRALTSESRKESRGSLSSLNLNLPLSIPPLLPLPLPLPLCYPQSDPIHPPMPARRKPAPRPQPVALPSPTTDPVDGDSTPAWSSSVFPPVPSYAASDRSLSPSPSEDDREPTPWGGNTRHKASHSMDTPGAGLANRFARLLGGGASTQQQQPLSSEEIERQAMEDRDRSRREAERLLALEHEREAGGPPLQHQQFEEGNGGGWYGQGQQKTQVTSSQSPAVERTVSIRFVSYRM